MTIAQRVDTVVVGGGQAGIAMSEHLTDLGIPHLVFERDRIAERWRTARWDSLVTNGPAWHERFPEHAFKDVNPESFVPKDSVADYFESYAKRIDAPVRTGVEVTLVRRAEKESDFTVETTSGTFSAKNIVCATGPFQIPVIPNIVPQEASIYQIHSSDYKNPRQLPDGAVLVVGSGSSGVQIADELNRSGKKVFLSIAEHERPPRVYRGRDLAWWLGVFGAWDAEKKDGPEVAVATSGAYGGQTVDFRKLAHQGITLLGRTKSYTEQTLSIEPDLKTSLTAGDQKYLAFLRAADAYVQRYGVELPKDEQAYDISPDPESVTHPIKKLDLRASDITTIIWATGFRKDYSWLDLDVFDNRDEPQHSRGISTEPGVYFLGLPWLSSRASSFICGVWHDAKYISGHISKQKKYSEYDQFKKAQIEV